MDDTKKIINGSLDVVDKWISENDKNMYDALNKGVNMAEGEIIGIVNSDDWLECEALEHIYNASRKLKSSYLYVGNTKIYDPEGSVSVERFRAQKSSLPLWLAIPFDHQTCFFRVEAYQKLGGYDTSFSMISDYDFILRFMRSGLPYSLIDGHTNNFMRGGMSSFKKSYKDIWKVLRKNGYSRITSSFGIFLRALIKVVVLFKRRCGL